MNVVGASTYLYPLLFLSSVSYNFLSRGFSHPWLNLFLGIFDVIINMLFSLHVLYVFLFFHATGLQFHATMVRNDA